MSGTDKLVDEQEKQYHEDMDMQYAELQGEAISAETMYWAQKAVMDEAKKAMDAAKADMIALDAKGIEFLESKVDHRTRKGAFDMKKLQRELDLDDDQLNYYRKTAVKMVYIERKKP